ncbi:pyridoxamine 5'-phosphate oxidase family protein [Aeromicrobium sp.]|uniref:pyridoxine/pyridoxamine 5'-phosphate oxidase n=1 Tax=Aeromicrobium sp. TaxID=1871063 RepID=UPI0030BBD1C7
MPDSLRSQLRSLPVFAGPLPDFELDSALDDPEELFVEWLESAIAAGVPEPHAMSLATVDAGGQPSSRVLVLKDLTAAGWQFATGRTTRKGRELRATQVAALNFYWQQLGRQVRVAGTVIELTAEESAADFRARPGWSEGAPIDPDWQLYAIRATEVEFWQADRDRHHRRLIYRRAADGWDQHRP